MKLVKDSWSKINIDCYIKLQEIKYNTNELDN